ncbi:hypothetical protein RIF29_27430 [Crotalaria pallida]|uniref:RNase H type-1 domain-containing protein n=1 Tax=Crotalaria pallida TaxID=3830 RepID=A0AAN9EPR1_CROPI
MHNATQTRVRQEAPRGKLPRLRRVKASPNTLYMPSMTEFRRMLRGLQFSWEVGIIRLLVEFDSTSLISLANGNSICKYN